jgi:hypothetical protein
MDVNEGTTLGERAAIIPHGNILSPLMREQNTIVNSAGGDFFFRFMPLCLFLKEDFAAALEILQKARGCLVIQKPVLYNSIIAYPVTHEFGITEVFPDFLIKDDLLCAARAGIVTAFSPASAKEPQIFPPLDCKERAVSVFRLCAIEFFSHGETAWSWNIIKTKWFKMKKIIRLV